MAQRSYPDCFSAFCCERILSRFSASQEERLQAFIDTTTDYYAILQLKRVDETLSERFASRRELEKIGRVPEYDHYEVIYVSPLYPDITDGSALDNLYMKFNTNLPQDYRGHSLSVSDIVALKQDNKVTCHYVDSLGFWELKDFIPPENYLKNAEMSLEDDYGMIDGVINNGKASVLEQLKETTSKGREKKLSFPTEREIE